MTKVTIDGVEYVAKEEPKQDACPKCGGSGQCPNNCITCPGCSACGGTGKQENTAREEMAAALFEEYSYGDGDWDSSSFQNDYKREADAAYRLVIQRMRQRRRDIRGAMIDTYPDSQIEKEIVDELGITYRYFDEVMG